MQAINYPEPFKIRSSHLVASIGLPNTWYLFSEYGERETEIQISTTTQGMKFIWSNLQLSIDMKNELHKHLISAHNKL